MNPIHFDTIVYSSNPEWISTQLKCSKHNVQVKDKPPKLYLKNKTILFLNVIPSLEYTNAKTVIIHSHSKLAPVLEKIITDDSYSISKYVIMNDSIPYLLNYLLSLETWIWKTKHPETRLTLLDYIKTTQMIAKEYDGIYTKDKIFNVYTNSSYMFITYY